MQVLRIAFAAFCLGQAIAVPHRLDDFSNVPVARPDDGSPLAPSLKGKSLSKRSKDDANTVRPVKTNGQLEALSTNQDLKLHKREGLYEGASLRRITTRALELMNNGLRVPCVAICLADHLLHSTPPTEDIFDNWLRDCSRDCNKGSGSHYKKIEEKPELQRLLKERQFAEDIRLRAPRGPPNLNAENFNPKWSFKDVKPKSSVDPKPLVAGVLSTLGAWTASLAGKASLLGSRVSLSRRSVASNYDVSPGVTQSNTLLERTKTSNDSKLERRAFSGDPLGGLQQLVYVTTHLLDIFIEDDCVALCVGDQLLYALTSAGWDFHDVPFDNLRVEEQTFQEMKWSCDDECNDPGGSKYKTISKQKPVKDLLRMRKAMKENVRIRPPRDLDFNFELIDPKALVGSTFTAVTAGAISLANKARQLGAGMPLFKRSVSLASENTFSLTSRSGQAKEASDHFKKTLQKRGVNPSLRNVVAGAIQLLDAKLLRNACLALCIADKLISHQIITKRAWYDWDYLVNEARASALWNKWHRDCQKDCKKGKGRSIYKQIESFESVAAVLDARKKGTAAEEVERRFPKPNSSPPRSPVWDIDRPAKWNFKGVDPMAVAGGALSTVATGIAGLASKTGWLRNTVPVFKRSISIAGDKSLILDENDSNPKETGEHHGSKTLQKRAPPFPSARHLVAVSLAFLDTVFSNPCVALCIAEETINYWATDAETWIRNGWVDEMVRQTYVSTEWVDECNRKCDNKGPPSKYKIIAKSAAMQAALTARQKTKWGNQFPEGEEWNSKAPDLKVDPKAIAGAVVGTAATGIAALTNGAGALYNRLPAMRWLWN